MQSKVVISELTSSYLVEVKDIQQKYLKGSKGVIQIALYSPGSFIFQYVAF